jgi:hypothetical protein
MTENLPDIRDSQLMIGMIVTISIASCEMPTPITPNLVNVYNFLGAELRVAHVPPKQ